MYTQCPRCRTIFEIAEDALQASLGIVRCGHCGERFDALRTLSNTLPTASDASLPEHDPDALAPTLTSAVTPTASPTKATEPSAPSGEEPAKQPGEAWFEALAAERARDLIADAAGIPPEAIRGDLGWPLMDAPLQAHPAEMIPAAAGPVPATAAGFPASSTFVPAGEAAGSEPFTEAWGLDAAVAVIDASAAVETSHDAGVSPDPPRASGNFPDDPGITGPCVRAGSGPDPDDTDLRLDESRAGGDPALDIDLAPQANPTAEQAREEPATDAAGAPATGVPVYVPPPRRRIHRSDVLWSLGCVALAVTLAMQVVWASRVALIRDPATQAQALRVCARIGCRLPPIRDTAKLELLSRDIRPAPGVTGVLAITATFRNDAPYRQPWPIVVVELTDLDNNIVAMRRFRSVEYMPDRARRAAGIMPGATAAVAFEVVDPGKRAVSFHFGFE